MKKNKTDLETWLTKEQVAQRLGVKPRTVVDMREKKQLNPQLVKRAGLSPVNLYDPAEVDQLLQARADAKMRAHAKMKIVPDVLRDIELTKLLPKYVTVNDAAQMLGMNPSAIYALIGRGQLRAVNAYGRLTLVERKSIQEFIRARKLRFDGRIKMHEGSPGRPPKKRAA